jgi:hypothetical protein
MPPSTTLPVSVLIVTHRFDERLLECLESTSWARERLILTTTTQPKTTLPRDIQLTRIAHIDDFSQARNSLLARASQDWVLCIDSDEVLPAGSGEQIAKLISERRISGFSMKRRDWFWGRWVRHGEVGQFNQVRLAKRGRIRFSRPVHEVPSISGVVTDSDITLNHYPHPTLSEFLASVTWYASLEAAYRLKRGLQPSYFQMVVFPPGKLFYAFLWWGGWRDGAAGLAYSVMMSIHSILVRIMMLEQRNKAL